MCEKPSQLACPGETAKVHGWCIVGAWVVVVVVVVPRLFDRGKHGTELRMAFLDPTWLCILTSVRFRSAIFSGGFLDMGKPSVMWKTMHGGAKHFEETANLWVEGGLRIGSHCWITLS